MWILMMCVLGQTGEVDAIKEAALGYLDGWFQSDAKKMESALHPYLHKFRVSTVKNSSHQFLDVMTADELIGISGVNQQWVKDKGHGEPEILFYNSDIAVVFAQSDGFYDLINLAKINGSWKIVQVLWQVGEGKSQAP
ncbi:MAG: nuclear transport factor 2 family protein [Acidobacteria bacterium]|nr:nuclear transport factor 2 family protein [Acidobacteriota bacterium]